MFRRRGQCAQSGLTEVTDTNTNKGALQSIEKAATILAALSITALSACGTTYAVPDASETHTSIAAKMFAEEQNPATAQAGHQLNSNAAVRQFHQVVSRVEPAAERFCKQETVGTTDFDCDIQVVVDYDAKERNAYQFYKEGKPTVAFTLPMIADARNPDELAFVLGHEMGHHIGQHISKQKQQAMAGALILGAVTAYSQASATAANPYRYTGNDSNVMQSNMELGASAGSMAYSQAYELESDVIGTAITAMAGYDPVKGARFFARPEEKTNATGLSFWGTHPPDRKRLATVLATVESIKANGGIARKKTSKPES